MEIVREVWLTSVKALDKGVKKIILLDPVLVINSDFIEAKCLKNEFSQFGLDLESSLPRNEEVARKLAHYLGERVMPRVFSLTVKMVKKAKENHCHVHLCNLKKKSDTILGIERLDREVVDCTLKFDYEEEDKSAIMWGPIGFSLPSANFCVRLSENEYERIMGMENRGSLGINFSFQEVSPEKSKCVGKIIRRRRKIKEDMLKDI